MAFLSSVSMFVSLFLCFFTISSSTIAAPTDESPSSKLLRDICNTELVKLSSTSCLKTLESYPQLSSASDLNTIAITIVELGVGNATKTSDYINGMLKKSSITLALKRALRYCFLSYGSVIGSFNSALVEMKEDKEYETASYDVLIAVDNSNGCERGLASLGVNDQSVSNGNKFVVFFGYAAYGAIGILMGKAPPPPDHH